MLLSGWTVLAPSASPAESAALLNGGERAFLSGFEGEILDVDLKSGRYQLFHPEEFGAPKDFIPEAASSSGFLIGTAGRTVYACDLDKRKAARLYEAPDTLNVGVLAYNPRDGGVLVGVSQVADPDTTAARNPPGPEPLLYIPSDPAAAGPVFCRRVHSFNGAAFGQDGRFYFGTEGDLWAGTIDRDDPPEKGDPQRYILTAERIAAVATRETSLITPEQMGTDEVAVDRGYLYFRVDRMGGAGWGELGRMKLRADAPRDEKASELLRYARRNIDYLSSLESLGPCNRYGFLCSSPDGRHVLYRLPDAGGKLSDGTIVLFEDGRKKRQFELSKTP